MPLSSASAGKPGAAETVDRLGECRLGVTRARFFQDRVKADVVQ